MHPCTRPGHAPRGIAVPLWRRASAQHCHVQSLLCTMTIIRIRQIVTCIPMPNAQKAKVMSLVTGHYYFNGALSVRSCHTE